MTSDLWPHCDLPILAIFAKLVIIVICVVLVIAISFYALKPKAFFVIFNQNGTK